MNDPKRDPMERDEDGRNATFAQPGDFGGERQFTLSRDALLRLEPVDSGPCGGYGHLLDGRP